MMPGVRFAWDDPEDETTSTVSEEANAHYESAAELSAARAQAAQRSVELARAERQRRNAMDSLVAEKENASSWQREALRFQRLAEEHATQLRSLRGELERSRRELREACVRGAQTLMAAASGASPPLPQGPPGSADVRWVEEALSTAAQLLVTKASVEALSAPRGASPLQRLRGEALPSPNLLAAKIVAYDSPRLEVCDEAPTSARTPPKRSGGLSPRTPQKQRPRERLTTQTRKRSLGKEPPRPLGFPEIAEPAEDSTESSDAQDLSALRHELNKAHRRDEACAQEISMLRQELQEASALRGEVQQLRCHEGGVLRELDAYRSALNNACSEHSESLAQSGSQAEVLQRALGEQQAWYSAQLEAEAAALHSAQRTAHEHRSHCQELQGALQADARRVAELQGYCEAADSRAGQAFAEAQSLRAALGLQEARLAERVRLSVAEVSAERDAKYAQIREQVLGLAATRRQLGRRSSQTALGEQLV